MAFLLLYQLFYESLEIFYFILFKRVIFCGLVAVNSWPITLATFCRWRRNLCATFKGAAGKIGSVGGSDGLFLLDDEDRYCDGPGDCPILLSSSSSSSLLRPLNL